MITQATPLEIHIIQVIQKTLLKQYRHPLPPKTSYCNKTIGSRELIFGTIHIKKCMNNLEFFQPNLRWSRGEFSFNCPVWRGMTLQLVGRLRTNIQCPPQLLAPLVNMSKTGYEKISLLFIQICRAHV